MGIHVKGIELSFSIIGWREEEHEEARKFDCLWVMLISKILAVVRSQS